MTLLSGLLSIPMALDERNAKLQHVKNLLAWCYYVLNSLSDVITHYWRYVGVQPYGQGGLDQWSPKTEINKKHSESSNVPQGGSLSG